MLTGNFKKALDAAKAAMSKDDYSWMNPDPENFADLLEPEGKKPKSAKGRPKFDFSNTFKDKTSSGFADFGKTIQDSMLKQADPNTAKLDSIAKIGESGNKIQERIAKGVENFNGGLK
jgi:hypothetical protein